MAGNVRVVFNNLPKIAAALPDSIIGTVRDAALKCETYAKALAPVDTGALRTSIKAVPVAETEWEIAPNTEYDIYVEFGTRKMAAQPYMRPAAEKIRKEYPGLVTDSIVFVIKGQGGWFKDNAPDVQVEELVR